MALNTIERDVETVMRIKSKQRIIDVVPLGGLVHVQFGYFYRIIREDQKQLYLDYYQLVVLVTMTQNSKILFAILLSWVMLFHLLFIFQESLLCLDESNTSLSFDYFSELVFWAHRTVMINSQFVWHAGENRGL
ncbi:Hypothetical_protein [Hexamita inflata]|uniref:Hypothetical_protein n=1 Tax=Hexamita inflata TaxID=28002 RepID=A0AA86QDZ3_9EUKA|nr:Hypothetical protein HINF_LOCUS42093 [Hexamita inflata]CAI9954457.1 Hypothetical protein HINF_LOCUS42102 [Hexamita inflata]